MTDQTKKINYAYKRHGRFQTIFSCVHPEVTEQEFRLLLEKPSMVRDICPGIKETAYCEQCNYYGRKTEFLSEETGETRELYNGGANKLAE